MKSRGRRAKKGGLLEALFTTTQQRVLSPVFGQPDRAFGKSGVIHLGGGGSGAVQREVQRLVSAGLVTERNERGPKDAQANARAPLTVTPGASDGEATGSDHLPIYTRATVS